MFYGEYEHAIDRKGRVIIPAKFREVFKEQLVERLYVTRGLDSCLFLFTEEEWRLQESRLKSLSFTKAEARRFNRLYFSGAAEAELDRQGRLLLPKALKDFAEIKRDLMIVGVANRIELWAKEKWTAFMESARPTFEEIAERLME